MRALVLILTGGFPGGQAPAPSAAAFEPIASEVRRTVTYLPFAGRTGLPCLAGPLNAAPAGKSTVAPMYLPGADGGVKLDAAVSGSEIHACLADLPPEAGIYTNSRAALVLDGAVLNTVSLQLTAKHHWILAVLTILAGVVLAFLAQRYIGVVRVLNALEIRAAAALAAIPDNLAQGFQVKTMAQSAAQEAAGKKRNSGKASSSGLARTISLSGS